MGSVSYLNPCSSDEAALRDQYLNLCVSVVMKAA